MTHRERFRRLMHFQTVDRGIHWDFGYLDETMDRWCEEGLPEEVAKPGGDRMGRISAHFGRDPIMGVPAHLGMNPGFEYRVVKETERTIFHTDGEGNILEQIKEGQRTIPHVVENGLKNREDWETKYKPKFDPNDPARHQWDYAALADQYNQADVPVMVSCGSFIGTIRGWVGAANLGLLCYDDPELVSEMVNHLCDLSVAMLEPALEHIEVDLAWGWEDICFNNGPLIGPNLWRELISEPMTRVMKCLRQHGVDVILTDCDGNIQALQPVWLECGLNGAFPCEVAGNSDPIMLRDMFGHDILLFGGVNKRMMKTKEDVLAELKRLTPLLEDGAFIPFCDHRVPEYVPLDVFKYYEREKLALLGFSQEEADAIEPLRGMKGSLPSVYPT
jgi:uroporphyrinogen decarboxylase